VETEKEYQITSNFIAYDGLNIGEGYTEFERYDKVQNAIEENVCALDEEKAIQVLADVGVSDGDMDKLQWLVLYNLTNGKIFVNRRTNHILKFRLGVDK